MSTTTTAISWTDCTWNPVRGCSRVSTGCEHCYAERQAGRFSGPGQPYAGLVRKTSGGWRWTGEVRLIATELETPLRWTKPRRIFVNSMSDLFHDSVSEDLIDAILAVMALAPQHTFQVLTKRPARMMAYMTERWPPARAQSLTLSGTRLDLPAEPHGADRHRQILNAAERLLHGPLGEPARFWTPEGGPLSHVQPWPLPNVWLGTSVEDQATAEARIPWLLQTPAAVRFVIYEPALEAVDVAPYLDEHGWTTTGSHRGLDWVICGGESGPQARHCSTSWLRQVVHQCAAATVPCFVKQVGSRPTCDQEDAWPDDTRWTAVETHPGAEKPFSLGVKLHDRNGADPAEWPADLRVQQWPEGAQG
jgi:protein gp37